MGRLSSNVSLKMKYHTNYQVDEELSLLAAKQSFFKVYLKKKWLLIIAIFIGSIIIIFNTASSDNQLAGHIGLALSAMLTTLWVKSYYSMLSHSRSAYQTTGGGMMKVDITDETISITTEGNSRRIKMDMVTDVKETKDFLVLISKKTPVFMPLTKELSPEVRIWLLEKKWANKAQ